MYFFNDYAASCIKFPRRLLVFEAGERVYWRVELDHYEGVVVADLEGVACSLIDRRELEGFPQGVLVKLTRSSRGAWVAAHVTIPRKDLKRIGQADD